jgi:hypothetical protein
MPKGAESGGLTSAELLQLVHERGFDLTERQLETLRSQDLIERPSRGPQDGRLPTWVSPPATAEQLLRICALRERTRDPHELAVLAWVYGADMPIDRVRDETLAVLRETSRQIEQELATEIAKQLPSTDPALSRLTAMVSIADRMADLRRKNTILPRFRSADGVRKAAFRLAIYLGVTGEMPPLELGTATDLERLAGVLPRAAHDRVGDSGPWHDGQPIDLEHFASFAGLPALLAAMATATTDELVFARRAIRPLTRGMALISTATAALYGTENHAGLQLFRWKRDRLVLEPLLLALFVSMSRTNLNENLVALVDQIERTTGLIERTAQEVRQAPKSLLRQGFSAMSARQKEQYLRLAAAFRLPQP